MGKRYTERLRRLDRVLPSGGGGRALWAPGGTSPVAKTSLPFLLNMDSFSTGSLSTDDGFRTIFPGYDLGDLSITSSPADYNAKTPNTNSIQFPHNDSTGFLWKFPSGLLDSASEDGIRIAILIVSANGSYNRECDWYAYLSEENITDDSENDDWVRGYTQYNANTDAWGYTQRIAGSDVNVSAKVGVNTKAAQWFWLRYEFDTDGTQHLSGLAYFGGTTQGPYDRTGAFVNKDWQCFGVVAQTADAGPSHCAAIWVGKLTDAWPTGAPGTTTETWP